MFSTVVEPDLSFLQASLWMHYGELSGNAIAISPRRALTALHATVAVGTAVSLRTSKGAHHNARVVYCSYSPLEYDIAVIESNEDQPDFKKTIDVARHPVTLGQKLRIIGLKNINNETCDYLADCQVNVIHDSSSIIESDYTSHDGLSGAGIITVFEGDAYHLVGIHVASHDSTSEPPTKKKEKRTPQELGKDVDSLSDDLHGHRAYTLICEAIRVPGLIEFLSSNIT